MADIKTLADLVTVRAHLQALLNSNNTAVAKGDYRKFSVIVEYLDKAFIKDVDALFGEQAALAKANVVSAAVVPVKDNKGEPVLSSGAVVVNAPTGLSPAKAQQSKKAAAPAVPPVPKAAAPKAASAPKPVKRKDDAPPVQIAGFSEEELEAEIAKLEGAPVDFAPKPSLKIPKKGLFSRSDD